MNIKEALSTLDPGDDSQWTNEGLPRIDVVANLTGDKSLKRPDITSVAPQFNREAAVKSKTELDPNGDEPPATDDSFEANVESKGTLPEDEVEVGDVLHLDSDTVTSDPELLALYIAQAGEKLNDLVRMGEEIKKSIEIWSHRSAMAERIMQKKYPQRRESHSDTIKQYLKQQADHRERQALNMQRFLQAGTTPGEVIKGMQTASPLDAAMSHRKPALGSTRPASNLPVQRGSIINTE